ncbi:coiled-coil domain-containing protein [Thermoactinospora rubra]|uniref:coiled-coil domain-containing protein n=1 Tax=Thermoactinospora rubra TaxID=1088767 RepID=UPI000A117C4B|nr:hypothetical protein [Thermoactinospora rubra]
MRRGRYAVCAALLVALTAAPLSSGPAAADPDLRKLTKQAAALNKLYRGQLQSLEDLKLQVKKASAESARLAGLLATARGDVSAIAETTYIAGPLDPTRLLSYDGEPHEVLGQIASMSYLASERASRLQRLKELADNAKKAQARAREKIGDLEKEIKDLQGRRRDVERLLAKYGFQQPGGTANLTPRMVTVRDEVLRNFPMPYGYGCFRAGDPGEHGKGRACDFMMSRGGTMATGEDADRGDALAQWLIDNGDRLGVMYIIWKQRYYDVRSGGGWDPMSDRGGVTANHWDHVHVSVF